MDDIDRFMRYYKGLGRAKLSATTRHSALRAAQDHIAPTLLLEATTDDLADWLASHPEWSANTRANRVAALRVFYKWAIATDRLNRDPSLALGTFKAKRGVPRPVPTARYREARDTAAGKGVRRLLMLEIPVRMGLRREEACKLSTDDFEAGILRVTGKGDRVRLLPVPPDIQELVDQLPLGWLFPSQRGGHIGPHRYGQVMTELLGGNGMSTHNLRHRFGTNVLNATGDLRVTQELMGHASPATTAIYTQLMEAAKRSAVEAAEGLL